MNPAVAADTPRSRLDARGALGLAVAIALLGLYLAWRRRFVQDDAFISFVYARSWIQGHGLTWFGDRVEGYTNFLWVGWIALGMRLGVDPIAWSWAGGFAAYAAVLHATWRLGLALCGRPLPVLLALFLLVTNASVAAFATGGLETMLQTALFAQAALQLVRLRRADDTQSTRRALALSLLLAAAVLTRMDSALVAAILGFEALRVLRRTPVASGGDRRRPFVALVLPFGLVAGGWLAWKLAYYGSVLPNTYTAKVQWDAGTVAAGALYLWRYLDAYLLWLFGLAAAVAWIARRARPAPGTGYDWGVLAIVTCTWWAYVVAVGGDFMEFRFLVPVAPFVCLLVAQPLVAVLPRFGAVVGVAAAAVLALASFQHARHFDGVSADLRLDSVPMLANFYTIYPDHDWSVLGRELGTQLAGTNAVLALHAAGAIPYYSGLRTLDMYGLNDRDVAAHGNPAPPRYLRPGHRRQVTLAQLRDRNVNLVLGHPTIIGRGLLAAASSARSNAQWVRNILSFNREPIGSVTLVGMPLARGGTLVMWYLTPAPAIDAVIRARGWETATVDVSQ